MIGLTAFGLGEGLLVQSHWGATPWTVITAGWLLGGTVGAATAFFAATIGFSIGASLRATEWIVRRVRP